MIKPKFARVVIERDSVLDKYDALKAAGFQAPDTAAKDRIAHAHGKVIATGPTCDESIQPGMRVLFGRYAGTWMKYNDDDIFVVNDEDIIAEIDDNAVIGEADE